jgi:hypothetical protein
MVLAPAIFEAAVHLISVLETDTSEQLASPILTKTAAELEPKPEPVIVTSWPPAPDVGEIEVIVGDNALL